jgi:aspartate dehydrogenase
MQHLALIGFGAIGQTLVETLIAQPKTAMGKLSVLVRATQAEQTAERLGAMCATHAVAFTVHTQLPDLLASRPDLVVECAGHSAVSAFGTQVLSGGTDLLLASVGSLADAHLHDRLQEAARSGSAQLIIPAGAVGGLDALGAARLSGLHEVTYIGRKPPAAWKGTDAENRLDLESLTEEAGFFEGTAREAALTFPKNANVAATVALAGAGLDETRVRLIADPLAIANTHEVWVVSEAMDFSLRLAGRASHLNPKTSLSTAYSLARVVLNRSAAIII